MPARSLCTTAPSADSQRASTARRDGVGVAEHRGRRVREPDRDPEAARGRPGSECGVARVEHVEVRDRRERALQAEREQARGAAARREPLPDLGIARDARRKALDAAWRGALRAHHDGAEAEGCESVGGARVGQAVAQPGERALQGGRERVVAGRRGARVVAHEEEVLGGEQVVARALAGRYRQEQDRAVVALGAHQRDVLRRRSHRGRAEPERSTERPRWRPRRARTPGAGRGARAAPTGRRG